MTSPEFDEISDFTAGPSAESDRGLTEEEQKIIAEHQKYEKEILKLTAAGIGAALLTGYGIRKYRNRNN